MPVLFEDQLGKLTPEISALPLRERSPYEHLDQQCYARTRARADIAYLEKSLPSVRFRDKLRVVLGVCSVQLVHPRQAEFEMRAIDAAAMPNKRVEHARYARSTRKSLRLLLAAHSQR